MFGAEVGFIDVRKRWITIGTWIENLATSLAKAGTDRLRSDAFHDLLKASHSTIVKAGTDSPRVDCVSLLGEPDRTCARLNQVLWRYDCDRTTSWGMNIVRQTCASI